MVMISMENLTATAATAPAGGTASAKATLRNILAAAGLADLTDDAYQLYIGGITDPDLLLVGLEPTPAFQMRFPGIRGPDGQLLMKPSEYVSYERTVNSLFAGVGLQPPSRAELGAIVQSGRSVAEVNEDLQAYDELRANPYVRDQFFLYTGHQPDPKDLFALALGMAPDLEQTYNRAISVAVNQQEWDARLATLAAQGSPIVVTAENAATAPIGNAFAPQTPATTAAASPSPAEQGIAPPPVNIYSQPALFRSERLRALRQASLADKAQFQAGGSVAVDTQRRMTAF